MNQFLNDFGPGILLMAGLWLFLIGLDWLKHRKPKAEPDEHEIFPGHL